MPLFPLVLPGVGVSPGANTCSFAKAPAATVIPGLVLLPDGPAGDGVLEAMAEAVRELPPAVLLNEGIATTYGRASAELAQLPGVRTVAVTPSRSITGWQQ